LEIFKKQPESDRIEYRLSRIESNPNGDFLIRFGLWYTHTIQSPMKVEPNAITIAVKDCCVVLKRLDLKIIMHVTPFHLLVK
jgi:hypothetical protein